MNDVTKRAQLVFIVLLLVALIAIGQPWSFGLYKAAIVAMFAAGLLQIAVGNVPQDANPARFATLMAIFILVIAGLFGLSIWLAPILVNLGR